jgi:hypothetical protein
MAAHNISEKKLDAQQALERGASAHRRSPLRKLKLRVATGGGLCAHPFGAASCVQLRWASACAPRSCRWGVVAASAAVLWGFRCGGPSAARPPWPRSPPPQKERTTAKKPSKAHTKLGDDRLAEIRARCVRRRSSLQRAPWCSR